MSEEWKPSRGEVASPCLRDFPSLAIWNIRLPGARRSSKAQVERLQALDDRFLRVPVGGLRTHSVTRNYRAFARQIGLDADHDRNPIDQIARDRLLNARYVSQGPVLDGITVAMLETGIPLWALADSQVEGDLRIMLDDWDRLTIGDQRKQLMPVMSPVPEHLQPGHGDAVVFALGVTGVSTGTLSEALWHLDAFLKEV